MSERDADGSLLGVPFKAPISGVSARPWILERRNGLARKIRNRLVADDRFSED